jgi:transposase
VGKAKQTADRWHLLKNLGDALESFFLNKKDLLKGVLREPEQPAPEIVPALPWHTGGTSKQDAVGLHHQQERIGRYQLIQELSAKKVDVATIAQKVGVSRQTVYNYLRLEHPPDRRRMSRTYKPLIEPYKTYLLQRWNEGCRNVHVKRDEIQSISSLSSEKESYHESSSGLRNRLQLDLKAKLL